MIKPPCETCNRCSVGYRCRYFKESLFKSVITGEKVFHTYYHNCNRLRRLFCHYEPRDGERK